MKTLTSFNLESFSPRESAQVGTIEINGNLYDVVLTFEDGYGRRAPLTKIQKEAFQALKSSDKTTAPLSTMITSFAEMLKANGKESTVIPQRITSNEIQTVSNTYKLEQNSPIQLLAQSITDSFHNALELTPAHDAAPVKSHSVPPSKSLEKPAPELKERTLHPINAERAPETVKKIGNIREAVWVADDAASFFQSIGGVIDAASHRSPPKVYASFDFLSLTYSLSSLIRLFDGKESFVEAVKSSNPADIGASIGLMIIALLQLVKDAPILLMDVVKTILVVTGSHLSNAIDRASAICQGALGSLINSLNILFATIRFYSVVSYFVDYMSATKGYKGDQLIERKLNFFLSQMELSKEKRSKEVEKIINTELEKAINSNLHYKSDPEIEALLDEKIEALQITNEKLAKNLRANRESISGYLQNRLKTLERKEQERLLKRVGPEVYARLQKEIRKPLEERITARLKGGDPQVIAEAKSLIRKLEAFFALNSAISGPLTILVCAIGLVCSIAGIFVTGSVGVIVLAVAAMISSLLWLMADIYWLGMAFRHDDPGKYDKLILALVGLIFGVTATAGLFLATTPASVALILALSLIWLVIMLALIYKNYRVRKKKKEIKPFELDPLIETRGVYARST